MKWHLKRSAQYFGTGDLEMPKPSLRQIEEAKSEEIADMLFRGKLKSADQMARYATKLEVEPWQLEMLAISPNVQKALEARVRALALARMPGVIDAQADKAEEGDTQAATFVAKVGEVIKTGGGVTVQNNMAVDQRKGGEPEQVIAFIETFRQRQLNGVHRKLKSGSDSE